MNPTWYDVFATYLVSWQSQIIHYAGNYSQNGNASSQEYIQGFIYRNDASLPLTLTGPATYNSELGSIAFDLTAYDGQQYTENTYINGTVNTLTIGAVPEPSTWAMMILGFLGLGFIAYRRSGSTLRIA
jgi:hypothetical protein